jgi:acyl-CoA thioesterase-2
MGIGDDETSEPDLATAVTVAPTGRGEGWESFAVAPPDWFGDRLFGGMILAYAANAALHTVEPERPMHSMHGYFLRAVRPGERVDVRVEHLRDGRTFATREITVAQAGVTAFRGMCSFHAPEAGAEYQLRAPDVPPPDDVAESEWGGPFEARALGPTERRPDGTYASTHRVWFRLDEDLPDDPAVHTTLVAYASDMTSTSFRPLNLGEWGTHTDASLDHAVWFHRPARVDDWLLHDFHALVNTAGRSVVRGACFDRDGRLVMSMAQELLIRPL